MLSGSPDKRRVRWPLMGVAAGFLGFLLCPFAYVATGAMLAFPVMTGILMMVPLVVSAGYLVWRFLFSRPGWFGGMLSVPADVLGLAVIAVFLFVISGVRLLIGWERVGVFFTLYLAAFLISLPMVIVRRAVVAEKLKWLPISVAATLLVVVLLGAVAASALFLFHAPKFI